MPKINFSSNRQTYTSRPSAYTDIGRTAAITSWEIREHNSSAC